MDSEDATSRCRVRRVANTTLVYRLTCSADGEYALEIETETECARAEGITTERETAEALFDLFSERDVFPCHLFEILEDLL